MEVVIAPARLHRPGDGDTFDLLVNFRRKNSWRDAQVVNVRLAGYMARENEGLQRDTPELDANGDVVRVSGREASRITTDVLTTASLILVEFVGLVSFSREVCNVWVRLAPDPVPQPLGAVLLARKVVLPGKTMGLARG